MCYLHWAWPSDESEELAEHLNYMVEHFDDIGRPDSGQYVN